MPRLILKAKSQERLAHGYLAQSKNIRRDPQNCTIFCTKGGVAKNFLAEAHNFFSIISPMTTVKHSIKRRWRLAPG